MNNKKILFLINDLRVGGAEIVFINDINYLYKEGYDVYLGILYDKRDKNMMGYLSIPSERVLVAGFKNIFDLKSYFQFARLIKHYSINILYSTLSDANIVSRILKILNPSLTIFVREANIANKKSIKLKITDLFLSFLTKKIVAVSNRVKMSLVSYMSFYKNKIEILENGVEINENFKIPKKNNDTVVILSVGNLFKKKGCILLIESFKDLRVKKCNCKLYVVGEGPERSPMEDFIEKHNLGGNVVLVGDATKKQLENFYKNSDIFVLSSYWEGFPNVLLEAMSYGLPPIATRVGGAENIIEEGVSGFLVEVGNKDELIQSLLILLQNAEKRENIGRNARQRIINNYSLKIHIKKLKKLLEI